MKIRKRFVVEVEFSSTDGCGNPQDVTVGNVRSAIEGVGMDNLSVNVAEGEE